MYKIKKFPVKQGSVCPYCREGHVVLRKGRWGEFYGCENYPACPFTQPIDKREEEKTLEKAADDFLKAHGRYVTKSKKIKNRDI